MRVPRAVEALLSLSRFFFLSLTHTHTQTGLATRYRLPTRLPRTRKHCCIMIAPQWRRMPNIAPLPRALSTISVFISRPFTNTDISCQYVTSICHTISICHMTMSHIYVTSISHIDMSQLVCPPVTITLSCILIHLAFARTNVPSRSLSSVAHRNVPGRVFTRTSVRSLSAFPFPDTREPSFFTHPKPTSLRFLSYSTRLSSLSLSLSLFHKH